MLAAQLPVPRQLVVAEQVLVEVAGHGQVPGDQPAAARRLLAGSGELGGAEVAQRAQQPVPRSVGVVAQHYRLVDQADERLDHRVARQVRVRAHLLGRRHVERPGEHRKPGPQRLLGGGAQAVAPLDGGAQGLMPGRRAVPVAGQQPEPGLEPVGQVGQRQRPQPDGGQFDRERDPVQPPAQADHVRPVGGRDGETGHDHGRALREELHRVAVVAGIVDRQRVHLADMLPWHVERLPAGREQGHARRLAEHALGERRARVDEVLAGVEDEQHLAVAQVVQDSRALGGPVPFRQPQARRHRGGELRRIAQLRQLGDPGAVPVPLRGQRGRAQADPGLADPRRPDGGHQPGGLQERGEPGEFGLPADEPGELSGQQASPSRATQVARGSGECHGVPHGA